VGRSSHDGWLRTLPTTTGIRSKVRHPSADIQRKKTVDQDDRIGRREGADAHCHIGAQRLAFARVCDWLDDTMA